MVAVAQLVEQRIVVPLVTSSNLVSHPILKKSAETKSIKTTFPRFFYAHFTLATTPHLQSLRALSHHIADSQIGVQFAKTARI